MAGQPGDRLNMKSNVRTSLCAFAFCLGAVLAPTGLGAPLADSAVGVGTVLGNALNPAPDRTRPLDTEWAVAKHTPSGQLFRLPFAAPDSRQTAGGWEFSGQLEFGYIGGDADEQNARYQMYQDIDHGAYLNNFNLQLRRPKGGYTIELMGGGAGRHDQYYGLQFGRANSWKVKLFFSEIPHVFTDRYRTLWSGVGTGNLILLPGLTPGGAASNATNNAEVAATAAQERMTLGLTRKKSGVRVDLDLTRSWKGYLSYSLEKRKGARPFGVVWGNSGGTAPMEIPEPIDYDTEDLLAGVLHVGGLNAFNLRLSASRFVNKIDTLTLQEPYRIAPPGGVTTVPAAGAFTQGRIDLTPSNDAYNIRAEYTRSMPEFFRGYFTAVVSAGSWRQDDNLIPYTTIPNLTLANVTLLPGGGWDTLGALSRRSTHAAIDTRLVDLTLSLNPTSALNVKGKARFYETDNKTDPFLVVNPNAVYLDADSGTPGNQSRGLTLDGVTGVWGRLINDGSGQNILMGSNSNPAGNLPVKSTPYSGKQQDFGATADYRLNKVSSLNAAVGREINHREHRERDQTWEDKFKLGYANRGLGDSTVRVSYEFDRRRGDAYLTSSYNEYFSSALVPMPITPGANVTSWAVRTNSGFRAIDLADRDQQVINARINTMLRPNLDAGISGQLRKSDFPDSADGRTGQKQRSANVDLNYQPSPRQTIYGYYSYQFGRTSQASIVGGGNLSIGQVTALGVVTPANAADIATAPGGPIFPLASAWTANSTDRNHVMGVGLKQEIGRASLNLDYSYSTGRTRIGYTYTVGGALSANNAAFAGSRFPDMATDFNYLDASLRYPLAERLSARLVYRFQRETIRDWHYQNLDGSPVVLAGGGANAAPTAVMLDGGPHSYQVNWYGIMFQLKL